jgi:hypothetical protein
MVLVCNVSFIGPLGILSKHCEIILKTVSFRLFVLNNGQQSPFLPTGTLKSI